MSSYLASQLHLFTYLLYTPINLLCGMHGYTSFDFLYNVILCMPHTVAYKTHAVTVLLNIADVLTFLQKTLKTLMIESLVACQFLTMSQDINKES